MAESQLDLREILAIALKRKRLIIVPLLLISAVAFGGSYLLAPGYSSFTIIQVDAHVSLIGEVRGIIGEEARYRRSSRSESNERLNAIRNELTSSYYANLLYEKLPLKRHPEITERIDELLATAGNIEPEEASLFALQQLLKENVSVKWAAGDQIEITAASTDPALARDIADTLGTIFIGEKVKQELLQIRSSQDFSDLQLEKYEEQLASFIRQRTETEKELRIIQLDEAITSESNRSEITGEIDRTVADLSNYRNDQKDVSSRLTSETGLNTSTFKLSDSETKKRLLRELKQNQRRIPDLMIKYTWSDPQILAVKVRLNTILNEIEQENNRLVTDQFGNYDDVTRQTLVEFFNTRSNLDYLNGIKPYLESAMDVLTAKMNLIPEYEARLSRLAFEISATTDIRDRFKKQQESSTITQALVQDMSSSKYRIVEPARLAYSPDTPNRKRILLMGIMLGLIVGAGLALISEILDSTFKKPEEIETVLGLPVLGIAPNIGFMKKLER
ncbi:MAG: hypothetical protein V3T31_02225 [candidate division Zixibacteria bacterium]